ncbi:MAG: DNA polymerase ligase N-terminal domain-containing protein [Nitrospirota bacterium]|jgi:DNA ligase D-like protein (predicted 3'-phosphoesterase)
MAQEDKLNRYREKRDFQKTPEPRGKARKAKRKGPLFVIQKHRARRLHYDFRLEAGGVLKSWAVPKGPSLDPGEKRLAVPTEDHPLQYGDFEGTIPEGEYGAGTVMVWDTGTYWNLREDEGVSMQEALEAGHAAFWLQGKKLRGGFALNRTHFRGKENWLLVKMKDEEADPRRDPVRTEPDSALSGRSMEEIEEEG